MDWFQVCAVCAWVCTLAGTTPPPGYVKQPEQDQHPPKYEFGYDVKDGVGGSQGHLETRDGEFALGKYYVKLPSNEQKVDYFADDWGYHPLVEYKTKSASSSMSTQFALGEKAVAALSRQLGVEPPLELFKTKAVQPLGSRKGPQVSIQGATGYIPGPSDEPVHNSLDTDSYHSTSSTYSPPTVQVSTTPSSLSYESTTGLSEQSFSNGVEVSTLSPSIHSEKIAETYSTTESSPKFSSVDAGAYTVNTELQNQIVYSQLGSSGRGDFSDVGSNNEASFREGFQIQNQNSFYHQPPSRPAEYSTTVSPDVNQDHEVTSYLADTNAAVDVTGKGYSGRLPGIPEYSPNTRISAVLVGEGENNYEENEVRNEYNRYYGASTTQNPPKTILKPIVVSEDGHTVPSLALFSPHGSLEENRLKKGGGKLYHREGRLQSIGGYTTSSAVEETDTGVSKHQEHYSTPTTTTPHPVLFTPRLEPSLLTSSGNILAPIRAGVSLSTHQNEEDCNLTGDNKETVPSSGPDVEKQEIREEAVYKTTVDIQKSIPFEIHPVENNQVYSQQTIQSTYQQENKAELGEASKDDYFKSTPVDYNQVKNEEIYENVKESRNQGSEDYNHDVGAGYSQEQYGKHSQEEYRTPNVDHPTQAQLLSEQHYQSQEEVSRPPQSGYGVEQYEGNQYNRNNFLQQVVYAYHKMANNKQPVAGYPVNIQIQNQPLFVPNRLYYVYLQRYNPYSNRYGSQSQLYTNYRPPSTTPNPNLYSLSQQYNYNEENAQQNHGNSFDQTLPTYQRYNGESHYNINGNVGYAAVVNHDEGRHAFPEKDSSNTVYSNSGNEHQFDETRVSQEVGPENSQSQVQYQNSVNEDGSQYSEGNSYESGQQGYSGQYNSLGNSNVASGQNVHPDNQHVQYSSTGQGEDSYGRSNSQEEVAESVSGQDKYVEEASSQVHHSSNSLSSETSPQYYERTKVVEVEKPVHIHHPVPIEFTKIVEKPVPVVQHVPVHHTQIVEKPVPIPQPVEVTRVVEKHVPVPLPVQYTKVVAVEKPVAVPHPVPYAVTKLVAVDRPVAFPHPVPVPYAVPHPVGVPVPHLVPYPHVVPVPVKDYRPVYIYRKATGGRLLHRDAHNSKHFRPSQPVFGQYPPETYHVTTYLKSPHAKGHARGHGRQLCIEYGGFKPPLVPSTQIEDDPKATYGPPSEEKKH